jgi:hypothetical protein
MTSQVSQELSYQRLLRALGGYLDSEPPDRFRLMEVLDGFTLILEHGRMKPTLQLVHFERSVLAEQAEQLVRGRRVFSKGSTSKWEFCHSGYQDFLRALGYELDDSEAREISIDEIDDGLLVTYSYLDPTQGYSWRKQLNTLRLADIGEILKAAKNRKHRGFLKGLRR